jgi:hybrid cluster-associated redox disulfide protein
MAQKITGNMIVAKVLELDRNSAPIFLQNGMHCLGCPSSSGESIDDACAVHGIDSKKLVDELNEYFSSKDSE